MQVPPLVAEDLLCDDISDHAAWSEDELEVPIDDRTVEAALLELRDRPPQPHLSSAAEFGRREHNDGENLERLSRPELHRLVAILARRVEAQARDIADLQVLMTPFKMENVRLSRCLKWSQQKIQEAMSNLREFFKDPNRGEWILLHQEDVVLVRFFQRLVSWYKAISEEDSSTLRFYELVWMYERGDQKDKLSSGVAEVGRPPAEEGPGEVAREPGDDRPEGRPNGSLAQGALRLTSASLYDACRERSANARLQAENARLCQENASLLRANAALEREVQGMLARDALVNGAGIDAEVSCSRPSRAAHKLSELVARDARWKRLIDDPESFFSGDDVIDETYEKYLFEIMAMMSERSCSFKQAVEHLANQASRPHGIQPGGASASRGLAVQVGETSAAVLEERKVNSHRGLSPPRRPQVEASSPRLDADVSLGEFL